MVKGGYDNKGKTIKNISLALNGWLAFMFAHHCDLLVCYIGILVVWTINEGGLLIS